MMWVQEEFAHSADTVEGLFSFQDKWVGKESGSQRVATCRQMTRITQKSRTSSPPQLMEVQRQNGPEQFKILINGEDREIVPGSNGADEEIGIRALNSSAPCQVKKTGSLFEIFGGDWYVGKGCEMFLQLLELPLRPDTRKDFLTYRPHELNPCLTDQFFEFFKMRKLGAGSIAAQGERPDASVDKNVHGDRRCFL